MGRCLKSNPEQVVGGTGGSVLPEVTPLGKHVLSLAPSLSHVMRELTCGMCLQPGAAYFGEPRQRLEFQHYDLWVL